MSDSVLAAITGREPSEAEVAETLSKLRIQLKDAQKIGNLPSVETEIGTMSVPDLFRTVNKMTEELELASLKYQRAQKEVQSENLIAYVTGNGERKWREKNAPNKPLLPDEESLEQLYGLAAYTKLTPSERARARDIRPSDLAPHVLNDYFGKGSNSAKASELMRRDPTVYKLLRREAIKQKLL